MKPNIIVNNKEHLQKLIQEEIQNNGNQCDLNHIDVSKVTSMSELFMNSSFNGNISKWDVSNVEIMDSLFENSNFNGDISKWNVSKVETIHQMFIDSDFDGDISEWKPTSLSMLLHVNEIFSRHKASVPYWTKFVNYDDRTRAINNYWLQKELEQNLSINKNEVKKPKI